MSSAPEVPVADQDLCALQDRIHRLESILSTQLAYTDQIISELKAQGEKLKNQEELNMTNSRYIMVLSDEITTLRTDNGQLTEQIRKQSQRDDKFQAETVEWLYYLYKHQQKHLEYINQTFIPPLAKAFPDWISSLISSSQASLSGVHGQSAPRPAHGESFQPHLPSSHHHPSDTSFQPNPALAPQAIAAAPTTALPTTSTATATATTPLTRPETATSPPSNNSIGHPTAMASVDTLTDPALLAGGAVHQCGLDSIDEDSYTEMSELSDGRESGADLIRHLIHHRSATVPKPLHSTPEGAPAIAEASGPMANMTAMGSTPSQTQTSILRSGETAVNPRSSTPFNQDDSSDGNSGDSGEMGD